MLIALASAPLLDLAEAEAVVVEAVAVPVAEEEGVACVAPVEAVEPVDAVDAAEDVMEADAAEETEEDAIQTRSSATCILPCRLANQEKRYRYNKLLG